eukprot:g30403.t1
MAMVSQHLTAHCLFPWMCGCCVDCFLFIAVLLLSGVRILDPRPNDIVPVILREHIAKKRQDAGRSLKEVALACPGCEDLEERSERMFYLHLIYEVETESGTLWDTNILRRSLSIEALEKCPWKNIERKHPKLWSNQACKGDKEEKLMARRRYPILKSQECGDLTGDYAGNAFYARRRSIDRVIPHPFVMSIPVPFYATIGTGDKQQDCKKEMINRRRTWGSCSCRRRSSQDNLPGKGCRVDGVCMQRNTQVKSMHSLFFFGFPLRNVNPDWSGLAADQGRSEASDYIMEWIFNTYNDMLIKENRDAEGPRSSRRSRLVISDALCREALMLSVSLLGVHVEKLSAEIIAMIVFSFGPALLLYTLVFQQRYMGLLHMNGLFIILGVGVDDAFVIMDGVLPLCAVMSPAVHHASKACLCTSLTTFFAFFSNASSCFASIRTFGLFCASLIISNFCIDFTFFLAISSALKVCASERVKRKAAQSMPPKVQVEAQQEDADSLRPMEKWFHDSFFAFVRTFKLPLLGIFATFAVICMWTASYVTPDLKMPQVFSSNDNYERFLPVLSKRYEKKFNPYRLKVRIHLGVNADDPIDRGTTPDYNDCFFNCAGQKPNYVHLFATLGERTDEKKDQQHRVQDMMLRLCDLLQEIGEPDESGDEDEGLDCSSCSTFFPDSSPTLGDFSYLQLATEADLGGMPPLKCVIHDFKQWTEAMSNFCCDKNSDFVKFLEAPMPPHNKMYQAGSRNMEHFQDEVFFDRVDGVLVLRALVIEDGIKLEGYWDRFVNEFAKKEADLEPDLPKAIFATDMFAFHWFHVQETMNDEVFDGIKLSLFLAFMVLLFATGNVILAAISVSCIVAIVSSVLAFAVCMGWKTSVSEAVIYVMVIGLSVDYVIHLGDAYLECPDERKEDRVQFMVTKMGVSVVSGAISSAGAAIFMIFLSLVTQGLFLVKFGMVICYVICVSVVTSLVFFSALLLLVGPSGECGSLSVLKRKLPCFKRKTEEVPKEEEPKAVQPRLYSSVVRYRKTLARASMAHGDARELAMQLGHLAPQSSEIESWPRQSALPRGLTVRSRKLRKKLRRTLKELTVTAKWLTCETSAMPETPRGLPAGARHLAVFHRAVGEMMVTGGLGGLGLIASFHCAAEFDNPIITTSRSGRLGSGGASAMNMFEALKEMVPVYNRAFQTWQDSKILIDEVVYQVKYKIHSLPDEALRRIQEFLLEVKDKLQQIMMDMRSETKTDQATMADLADKDAAVTNAIALIQSKVGAVPRTCRLLGGLQTVGYTVPDGGSMPILPAEPSDSQPAAPSSGSARVHVSELMAMEKFSTLPKPIGPTTILAQSAAAWDRKPMVAELRFATDEGAPYDLRRLTASPRAGGGLVALETLESVQREVDFAQRAGRHPNIELLAEMPSREHRWVCGTVLAAARQLAVDLAVAEPSELAEMPLERLRTLASENLGFN